MVKQSQLKLLGHILRDEQPIDPVTDSIFTREGIPHPKLNRNRGPGNMNGLIAQSSQPWKQ